MDCICINETFINDIRKPDDFKITLINGFKKTEIISRLEKTILASKPEAACYLAYQLLASGYFLLLWDKLCNICFKDIRNHELYIWLCSKNKLILRIDETTTGKSRKLNLLDFRNSDIIRNIITEFILLMCFSQKKEKIYILKTKPNQQTDFFVSNFSNLLKHKSNIIISKILYEEDSVECKLASNEIAHSLINKNLGDALYWIEWINIWEKINKKNKKTVEIKKRNISCIDTIYQSDPVWLIWSVIFYIKQKTSDKLRIYYGDLNYLKLEKVLKHIWYLYAYKWKPNLKHKRFILICLYLNYLINPQDLTIELLNDEFKYQYFMDSLIIPNKLFSELKESIIL